MGFFSKAILFLFFVLLLLTPLLFSVNTNELYEFPKMFFVYLVGTTIIFLFVVRLKNLKAPVFAVALFVVSFVISTIFSSHLYTSLWGYYSRFNGGLISVLVFFGLYLVGINLFSGEDKDKLLDIAIFPVIPVSIYAIVQFISAGAHVGGTGENISRVYSTFGQPNWLAAYLVMMLPLILNKLLRATSNTPITHVASSSAPKAIFNKETAIWSVIFLLAFSALWFTYSMSGLLGFLFGVGAFLIFNLDLVRARFSVLVGVFAIGLLIACLNLGFLKQRVDDAFLDLGNFIGYRQVYAQDTPNPQKYQVSDPGFIRKGLWKGTLDLISSSNKVFLIGTGPETFPYAFQPFRPQYLNYSSEWDFILNKPHNYYLEIFSQNGAFGFLAYLVLIVWTLKKKHPVLTPALLGFYITNIFGWPTVSTSLLFWVFLTAL